MAVVERLSQEEFRLLEVIQHPVLFAEFIENLDILDDPNSDLFTLTEYQKEFIADFNHYVSLCCGRSVGKTTSLTLIILWLLVNNPYKAPYYVYLVPSKVHLEPVFTNLVHLFRVNSFLQQFLDKKKGINASEHKIILNNGSTLDCRIAGQSGTGENVVGLHTPHIIIDESAFFPWGTFIEAQPTLNTWEKGFRLFVSGVPDGRRERSVCYYADQLDEKYSRHRIPAHKNPRYTKEDDERNIAQYGGVNSDDYKHLVLGEHGDPFYAVFDRSRMLIKEYSVYKVEIDGTKYLDNITSYIEALSGIPGLTKDSFSPFIGVDLGYTDPTAILILYQDKDYNIKFHSSIVLKRVNYVIQEKIIEYLYNKFKPYVIAIDEGNIGKAITQRLITEEQYKKIGLNTVIFPVAFNGNIMVARSADNTEVYEKVKPFSIKILQEYTDLHKVIYSSTFPEIISELERMAYTKNINGEIIYKTLGLKGGEKANDHLTSALLCAIVAHYAKNELVFQEKKKELFLARWL